MRKLTDFLDELPVTAGVVFLASLIYAGTLWSVGNMRMDFHTAQIAWGASRLREVAQGEWWRLPVSTLHHGGILHLLLNASFLFLFGRALEPRLGPVRTGLVYLGSMLVTPVASWLISSLGPDGSTAGVGLSGSAAALFGAAAVLRPRDSALQEELSLEMMRLGWAWWVLCIPITWSGLLAIDNVAHFAGLLYGALLAAACLQVPVRRALAGAFLISHVGLIPGIYYCVNSTWSSAWHFERAYRARDEDTQEYHYRRAVEINPRLGEAWYNLTLIHFRNLQFVLAWETILEGLVHNPAYDKALRLANQIWEAMTPRQQRLAWDQLQEKFGDRADDLARRLALGPLPREAVQGEPRPAGKEPPRSEEDAAPPPVKLPADSLDPFRGPRPREFDPGDPQSASEGVAT